MRQTERQRHIIKSQHIQPTKGWTLIEVMMAVAIMSIAFLSIAGAFGNIAKSLHISKRQTLANSLAQQKIEYMKNISYYRLLVTTTTTQADEPGLSNFRYDTGFYPPESVSVGEMPFEIRVFVEKVTESGGVITSNNWYDNDTGLKRITAHVIWLDGNTWKDLSISNLRDNPNRQTIDATFVGTVKHNSTNLAGTTIVILQNPLLTDTADSSGAYSISVPAGTYDLKASKYGYFDSIITATADTDESTTVPFNLTPMGSGNISGTAYLNSHILLAELCAAVNSNDFLEYVVLYNPTAIDFELVDGFGNPYYTINYVRASDGTTTTINPNGTTRYITTTIPAGGYFLFASSANINGILADAYYSDASLGYSIEDNRFSREESGGIALVSLGQYEVSGSTVDAIGWGRGSSPFGPNNALEGEGYFLPAGPAHGGLQNEEVLERMAYSSSTATTMISGGEHDNDGNAYDTNVNSSNWVHHTNPFNDIPQNSSTIEQPQSGTPASGAMIFVDDGLSGSAIAGTTPPGSFSVTYVATGSWTVLIASNGWIYSASGIVITNGSTLNLGHVSLSTYATGGFISGRIVNDSNVGLGDINVYASGEFDTTDSDGYYNLHVDVGTYTIVANPDNENSSYTTGEATGIVVNAGQLSLVSNITLFPGGSIRGYVTTGTNQLPNIPLITINDDTGAEVAAAMSDALGNFNMPNLPTGHYTITPELEVGESASPESLTATVTAGNTVFAGTFTITNAFGTISGSVSSNGRPITTGVIIVAVSSSTNISDTPVAIDNSIRDGSVYYYSVSSKSDGTFSLPVRSGSYNLKAWYSTVSGTSSNVTPKSATANVTAGGTASANFTW